MDTKIESVNGIIDCACVIHGDAYHWSYVERLYNMLDRNLTPVVKFHVFTEDHRTVPQPWSKHVLQDFGLAGPKKAWWYKMQLFNPEHHAGPLLYFDLDTVIVNNIDWIWNMSLQNFWTVRDFKYLWRCTHQGINSSIMWWDTRKFAGVWSDFCRLGIQRVIKEHKGDQDYLNQVIPSRDLRFFNHERVQSWRWQSLDGGYDFKRRIYRQPNTGTVLTDNTSVLIFHGNPKPADIGDRVVQQHWI